MAAEQSNLTRRRRRAPGTGRLVAELERAVPHSLVQALGKPGLFARLMLLPYASEPLLWWLRATGAKPEADALEGALWEYHIQQQLRSSEARVRTQTPVSNRILRFAQTLTSCTPANSGLRLHLNYWLRRQFEARQAWPEAKIIQTEIRDRQRRRSCHQHRPICNEEAHLAWLTFRCGDVDAAGGLLIDALEGSRKVLPIDHPLILMHGAELAWINYKSGAEAAGAQQRLETLLPQCRDRLGPNHTFVRWMEESIATLQEEAGSLDTAERNQRGILERCRERWGESDPDYLRIAQTLASILRKNGKSVEALSLQERVVTQFQRQFGREAPETLEAYVKMAGVLFDLGDHDACAVRCLDVLRSLQRIRAPGPGIFQIASEVAEQVGLLEREHGLSPEGACEVCTLLREIGAQLRLQIELSPASVRGQVRENLNRYARGWLKFQVQHDLEGSLQPLVALHGLDAWMTAVDEVESCIGAIPEHGPEARYHAKRRKLLELRAKVTEIDAKIRALRSERVSKDTCANNAQLRSRLLAQRDELILCEKPILQAYIRARERRASANPNFAAKVILNAGKLLEVARLGSHAALVVLFEIEDSFKALILRPGAQANLCALPDLPAFKQEAQRYVDMVRRGIRVGVLRAAAYDLTEHHNTVPKNVGNEISLRSLTARGVAALWKPLQRLSPAVTEWHIVSGPKLHAVPFEFGRPAASVFYYPGLPAFYRQRACGPVRSHTPPGSLVMAVHAALRTSKPLPFVETESYVIGQITRWLNIQVDRRHGIDLIQSTLAADWLHIAGHGHMSGRAGEAHGTLPLDDGMRIVLDPSDCAGLPAGLRHVYFSTCMTGVMGNTEIGGALGLPAALVLRGMRVIGALAPLPDFYMPVVSALYYYARVALVLAGTRQSLLDAPAALDQVREQLRTGQWPDRVVTLLREAYSRRLHENLQMISTLKYKPEAKETLARARTIVWGWCLPESLRRALHDESKRKGEAAALRKFAAECCCSETVRERIVTQVIDRLIDRRASPPADVRNAFEYIASFLVCWGDVGGTDTAAQ